MTVGAGQRFGGLVVVSQCHGHRGKGTHWYVTCDCGATRIVRGKNLTMGNTVSCGDESMHPRSSGFESVGQTGMTFAEIGLALGISRSMARADFDRALRKLRNNQEVLAAMREHR